MKVADLVNERASRPISGTAVKLSDYVVSFLADAGVRHAFVVQGGAIAHIVDSSQASHEMYAWARESGALRRTDSRG